MGCSTDREPQTAWLASLCMRMLMFLVLTRLRAPATKKQPYFLKIIFLDFCREIPKAGFCYFTDMVQVFLILQLPGFQSDTADLCDTVRISWVSGALPGVSSSSIWATNPALPIVSTSPFMPGGYQKVQFTFLLDFTFPFRHFFFHFEWSPTDNWIGDYFNN